VAGHLGCATSQQDAAGAVTLVFTHAKHPQAAYLTDLVRLFEAENPGIRVREEILPSSSDEQHQFYVINLAAQAGEFDVLDMDVIWVPEFARAGWVAALDPWLEPAHLEPLHPGALRADRLNGRLYGVPWFVDTGVLYYRRDLLEKYFFQPPETYPELLRIAREILRREQRPELAGFLWQGKQYEGLVCTALEFIRGNGGDLLRADGAATLADDATVEAVQFMADLIHDAGVTPPLVTTLDEESARHIFQSGRAVFMRNWPYAWALLNAAESPVASQVGILKVPHFAGHVSAPTLGGYHLGINANSRHQAEAAALLRFFIREDVQKQILLKLGVLPAHRGVYEDPAVLAAYPVLPALLPALERVTPRPVTPYYLMISQILQPELSAAIAGIRTPQEAMQRAQQQTEHLLGLE